ncbi:MAG: GTPase HflX, partial [Acetatifactor sp.]|nr:GTPase HflX [Acetatifactor sp.]
IVVYNKADKCGMGKLPQRKGDYLYMAAGTGCGMEELLELIKEKVYADFVDRSFLIPYDKGNIGAFFMENAVVLEQEYRENGQYIRVKCHLQDAEKYKLYEN